MQCASLLKKRHLEPDVDTRSCKPKRACLEAGPQAECPMETSPSLNASNQQQAAALRSRAAPLICPRCLRGEPGHINHMMGI